MGDIERQPVPGRQSETEILDPHHFYAAYVFDRPNERDNDIEIIIEQSQKLGYQLRSWWLSDAMELQGFIILVILRGGWQHLTRQLPDASTVNRDSRIQFCQQLLKFGVLRIEIAKLSQLFIIAPTLLKLYSQRCGITGENWRCDLLSALILPAKRNWNWAGQKRLSLGGQSQEKLKHLLLKELWKNRTAVY